MRIIFSRWSVFMSTCIKYVSLATSYVFNNISLELLLQNWGGKNAQRHYNIHLITINAVIYLIRYV